jgi:quinol monooxygenase YgiN
MIIVSGRIYVAPGKRAEFIERSLAAVHAARKTDGCADFVVAADPVEDDRVNVYEEWRNETALLTFRGDGPGEDLSNLIRRADVKRYLVSRTDAA